MIKMAISSLPSDELDSGPDPDLERAKTWRGSKQPGPQIAWGKDTHDAQRLLDTTWKCCMF